MSEEPPNAEDKPVGETSTPLPRQTTDTLHGTHRGGIANWLRTVFGFRNSENTIRDSIDELIEEHDDDNKAPFDESEKALIANVLELRGRTINDVMVPRADIIAIESGTSFEDAIEIMTNRGHSRLPVYRDSLDDVAGMVHIKDLAAWRGNMSNFSLTDVQRNILFVSPSMRVLELLLEMRAARSHMAIVVDEYGGVDGLVTIEDLVEEIVGEIEDEHDRTDDPDFIQCSDGSYQADARVAVDVLEETFGAFLNDDEREDIDTLGGLVFSAAGHVPIRGELVTHTAGFEFQVMDADPRRIKRVRLRKLDSGPATRD